MRFALAFLSALTMIVAGRPASANTVGMSATVDRNRAVVGEPIDLTVELRGARTAPAPTINSINGLTIRYIGPTSRFETINGRTSTSVSHRYVIRATEPGRYRIGPFSSSINGQRHSADSITVDYVARGSAADVEQSPIAKLALTLSTGTTEGYVGQRIPLTIQLRVGAIEVDNLKYPVIESGDFIVDQMSRPSKRKVVENGVRYDVIEFRTVITPIAPGGITVGPLAMELSAVEPLHGRGRPDPFSLFTRTRRRPVELHADAVTLEISPLPTEDRPDDFSGAIGRFSFKAEISPSAVDVGDPITVTTEISGTGNLSSMTPPRIPVDGSFKSYDPLAADAVSAGRHKYEQVVIPNHAGIEKLPAVRFSYFDPIAGNYRTVRRGPFPIQVAAAAGGGARPRVIESEENGDGAATGLEESDPTGRDIVYIKDRPGDLGGNASAGMGAGGIVALQTLPLAGVLGAFVFARRRERLGSDPRLVRFRSCAAEARSRLRRVDGVSGRNAFDDVGAAIHEYLSAKLDLPPGAIDRESVRAKLPEDAGVADDVGRLFDVLDGARYAGAAGSQDSVPELVSLAEGVISALERSKELNKRMNVAASIVVVLALAGQATAAYAQDASSFDPVASFFRANDAYSEGRFDEAATLYEQVLADGSASEALLFNMGNAYFKLGRLGKAVLSYERARRFDPRDPDSTANLNVVRDDAGVAGPLVPLWQRLAFPLSTRASTKELARLSIAATWAACGLIALALLSAAGRPAVKRAAWVVSLVAVILTANLALRWSRVEATTVLVVTSAGESVVRFEPADSGTEHFRVREGALLETERREEGWVQVRRADGLRGWVEEASVEPVAPIY